MDAYCQGSNQCNEQNSVGHEVENFVIRNGRHDCLTAADGPEQHIDVASSMRLSPFKTQDQARQRTRLRRSGQQRVGQLPRNCVAGMPYDAINSPEYPQICLPSRIELSRREALCWLGAAGGIESRYLEMYREGGREGLWETGPK